ncbi:acyltransferase family protein [Hymenobacter guriensis]|uniref:acyltransferase family protein n=1 Tax=Hymenobacter guriensis TaxID=2793065 RepID=UPI0037438AC7
MIMTNFEKMPASFRYDINALRAIAVLGVILYHYKVDLFSGGFSGVDIFFVISGYLMSRILIMSIDNNVFSYKDYFYKRLRRIVPALIFLIFCITFSCFFYIFQKILLLMRKMLLLLLCFYLIYSFGKI